MRFNPLCIINYFAPLSSSKFHAKTTRICTYDRVGYGWSDRSPQPRSAETFASELHTLLVNAGEAPPYVLVGHSLGGYTVRVFASRYQGEADGMVLVEAAHEDQESRLPPEYADLERQQNNYLSLMAFMARFGILRLIGSASQGQDLAPASVLKMPEEAQPAYLALMSHPGYFNATLAELNALDEIKAEMHSPGNLGDLPLIVLTAGQTLDAAAMASIGFSGELDFEQIQQEWLVLQANLAGLSSNSRHIVVEGSSHAIQLDRPQAVIQAILEVVEIAR